MAVIPYLLFSFHIYRNFSLSISDFIKRISSNRHVCPSHKYQVIIPVLFIIIPRLPCHFLSAVPRSTAMDKPISIPAQTNNMPIIFLWIIWHRPMVTNVNASIMDAMKQTFCHFPFLYLKYSFLFSLILFSALYSIMPSTRAFMISSRVIYFFLFQKKSVPIYLYIYPAILFALLPSVYKGPNASAM